MKFFVKLFYRLRFLWMLKHGKRLHNGKIDNYQGLIVIQPKKIMTTDITIPKIIWIYWEGKPIGLVQKCIERIQKLHLDYEIHVLNPDNLVVFSKINIHHQIFKNATPQQRADLIRFDLLYHYGGFWLDASILVYEKLDWIIELCQKNQTGIFSYYRSKNTTNLNYPVLENWLLATYKENIFFKFWFEELWKAIDLTPKSYIQYIKNNYSSYDDIFQSIGRLEYLVAYVACQIVMRKCSISLSGIDCDKNAFYYQVKNNWIKEKVLINLAINRNPEQKPKLIKLVGKERKMLDSYYRKGMYFKGALLDI